MINLEHVTSVIKATKNRKKLLFFPFARCDNYWFRWRKMMNVFANHFRFIFTDHIVLMLLYNLLMKERILELNPSSGCQDDVEVISKNEQGINYKQQQQTNSQTHKDSCRGHVMKRFSDRRTKSFGQKILIFNPFISRRWLKCSSIICSSKQGVIGKKSPGERIM